MRNIIVAVAQSSSIRGNISENISIHLEYIDAASENNADIIIFPELSLTGYEPAVAIENALTGNENILIPLLNSAGDNNITIIAGCPIRSNYSKPYIGSLIIQPTQKITIYRKRYLHQGEENNFVHSQDKIIYKCKGETIGIAICADIDNSNHPNELKKMGITMYSAGVLVTPQGIKDAHNKLSLYAKKYHIVTMMSNHASETGGYQTAGQSAIWDEEGRLIIKAEGIEKSLLIAQNENDLWEGKKITI